MSRLSALVGLPALSKICWSVASALPSSKKLGSASAARAADAPTAKASAAARHSTPRIAAAPAERALLDRRERGRREERVFDARDDRTVLFGLGPLLVPFRVGLEGVP